MLSDSAVIILFFMLSDSVIILVICSGGDLVPSLGGMETFFAELNNSYDLFLVIEKVFLILTLSFQIPRIFVVSNVVYDLLHKEKPCLTKEFLFLLLFFYSI